MWSSEQNTIEIGIQKVLKELDKNNILSAEEKIELKDHFLCEVEELTSLGLRDEEALLIARKRFGILEDVNKEYQKVKPRFDWMRYGIIGVVVFCMVKILMITVDMLTEAFWMVYYIFDPAFVVRFIALDVPLRFLLVLILGLIFGKLMSKRKFKSLISFWQFPIIYLLIEVLRILFEYFFPPTMFNGSLILTLQSLNSNIIINYVLLGFMLTMVSYQMYRLKVIRMEYV